MRKEEYLARFQAGLSQLPDRERDLLVLKCASFFDGEDSREVAERLGAPEMLAAAMTRKYLERAAAPSPGEGKSFLDMVSQRNVTVDRTLRLSPEEVERMRQINEMAAAVEAPAHKRRQAAPRAFFDIPLDGETVRPAEDAGADAYDGEEEESSGFSRQAAAEALKKGAARVAGIQNKRPLVFVLVLIAVCIVVSTLFSGVKTALAGAAFCIFMGVAGGITLALNGIMVFLDGFSVFSESIGSGIVNLGGGLLLLGIGVLLFALAAGVLRVLVPLAVKGLRALVLWLLGKKKLEKKGGAPDEMD